MSLRPRYSLLTLLIFTALVAGGVKLWYGPHHVVERLVTDEEEEYTFTRNWRGQRVIHGPRVVRIMQSNVLPKFIQVHYFREGINTNWQRNIVVDPLMKQFTNPFIVNNRETEELELNKGEWQEYNHAVDREIESLEQQGLTRGLKLMKYISDKLQAESREAYQDTAPQP